VLLAPVLVCAQPLMGGRAAPPPRGGLGRCSRACAGMFPTPYGGPGCPAPPWGAGVVFAPVPVCARPFTGGRAAPPPRGGLGRILVRALERPSLVRGNDTS